MRTIKRVLLLFLSVIILSAVPLTVSAASSESKIKAQTTKYLNGIREYKPGSIERAFNSNAKKSFYKADNKHIEKVIRKIQKQCFKYEIRDINISGKNATVIVYVEYYDAYDNYIGAYKDLLKFLRGKKNYTLDASYKKWASYIWELYDDDRFNYFPDEDDLNLDEDDTAAGVDPFDEWNDCLIRTTVKIPLVKEGSTWKISKNTKQMQYMTDCRMSAAAVYIKKHSKEFLKYFIFGQE